MKAHRLYTDAATPTETMDELQEVLSHRVPIFGYWPSIGGLNSQGRFMAGPIIQLKARPDIADLDRLVGLEPEQSGDNWSQWLFLTDPLPRVAICDCRQKTPAACRFVLVFPIAKYRRLLDWIAETGMMAITIKPPIIKPGGFIEVPALFFETRVDQLRRMLALLDRRN
ncbi:MAG: hypothetical protein EPO21_14830 [Chloroflexota bacterium]|nr:MAG: hypothetical protein EPO21_14830 [Chloroflexota bacterium]